MHQLLPPGCAVPDLERFYLHPPGVRLGMVASVDGAATLGGGSRGLSGPADRQVLSLLRRHADVVLVGAGTARAESYRPVRVAAEHAAGRRDRGQAESPAVAVVSAGRGLDPGSPLLVPGSGLVLLTTRAGAARAPAHVDAVAAGEDGVDLARALDALRERGLGRVLCEGGPVLNGALLAAGLVDEVCVTTSPLLAGGTGPRLVAGAPEAGRPLRLASLLEQDGALFARWVRPA